MARKPVAVADPAIVAEFQQFLERNPASEIGVGSTRGGDEVHIVSKPWGDASLALIIPADPKPLAAALNAVILPERLSAIWHSDTERLEVVWTAFKLQKPWQELKRRSFEFSYERKKHQCSFGKSSERAVLIAERSAPQSTSPTNWRNLQSLNTWAKVQAGGETTAVLDEPTSFWIDNIKWDESKTLPLLQSLNFYLRYFDEKSPIVMIHTSAESKATLPDRTRYIRGKFPKKISGRSLNENLMAFWEAAETENPMMSFILYYRIIEYAASHYVDAVVRNDVRKVLSAPDLRDNMSDAIEKIVSAVTIKKLEDIQRFKSTIRDLVDAKLLWADIAANRSSFSKETKFEGGFTVPALIGPNETEADFCQRGLLQFADTIRRIRNTLSHGKDDETAGMITPTPANERLLRPWVHLIATAAGEVVLYKGIS